MNPQMNRGDKNGKNGGRGTDANLDPISKKPGAHPVGTGVGAALGGAAGIVGAGAGAVAAGTGASAGALLGGPVGALAGAAVGAVIGGLAGKAVAEKIDPTVEEDFWRKSYQNEPYFTKSYTYDDYGPAYRTGYEGFAQYNGKPFNEVERELEVDYTKRRGKSRLGWTEAKQAARSAWDRVSGGHEEINNSH